MYLKNAALRTAASSIAIVIGTAATSLPAGATDRACGLITRGEASAAMGGAVSAGTSGAGESGDRLCRYVSPRHGMLAITVAEQNGREKFEQAKANLQAGRPAAAESISGLGDEAVFANVSKGTSELLVLKGDKSVAITLISHSGAPPRAVLENLARKALSRI